MRPEKNRGKEYKGGWSSEIGSAEVWPTVQPVFNETVFRRPFILDAESLLIISLLLDFYIFLQFYSFLFYLYVLYFICSLLNKYMPVFSICIPTWFWGCIVMAGCNCLLLKILIIVLRVNWCFHFCNKLPTCI